MNFRPRLLGISVQGFPLRQSPGVAPDTPGRKKGNKKSPTKAGLGRAFTGVRRELARRVTVQLVNSAVLDSVFYFPRRPNVRTLLLPLRRGILSRHGRCYHVHRL